MSENEQAEEREDAEEAPWDLLASALGSLDQVPEDEEPLDYRETFESQVDESDPFLKVSLDQAQNLIAIQTAAEELQSGGLAKEQFLARLKPYMQPLMDGLELVKSEAVQAQLDELPEDQRALFDLTQKHLGVLLGGLQQMANYKQSESMEDVEAGLQTVERAFQLLDEVQDHAIDAGREYVLREEASGGNEPQASSDDED